MKLIASGVAICAGMMRSPSFSRSSSSTRMNMRPLRASSITSSGVDRKAWRKRAILGSDDMTKLLHSAKIACEHVDLDVELAARRDATEGRHLRSVRDDIDAEPDAAIGQIDHLVDGQRHAV